MNTKLGLFFIALAVIVSLGFGTPAGAVLSAVSPDLNAFGTPMWYRDNTGRQVGLCLDFPTYNPFPPLPLQVPTADPCLLDGLIDPTRPLFLPAPGDPTPANFPVESFYSTANALLQGAQPGNRRVTLVEALEVAFLGPVQLGQHVLFSRVQVDVNGPLTPGAIYTFTFPFGTITTTAAPALLPGGAPNRDAGILINELGNPTGRFRDEVGCAGPPCDHAVALGLTAPPGVNTVGPFLPAIGFPAALPGYTGLFLGDPTVDALITAGPGGNQFCISGPAVNPNGTNTLCTSLFSVLGKEFAPPCVNTLVNKYYTDILARPADAAGAAGWVAEVNRVISLGMTTKEGLLGVSKFFFNSAEYALRARTDAQYVADLYQTFFSRAPDAAGDAFWQAQLAAGLTRNMLLLSFANSAEFGLFLQTSCGTTPTRPEFDFVNDYYRGFLNRLPDTAGLNGWAAQMKTAQCSATPAAAVSTVSQQIATAFAPGGAEYLARARTNAQYVEDLYDAILRRSADPAGFTVWVDQLTAGTPRINLLNAFLTAPEFTTRVNNVAAAGCAP